MNAHYQDIHQKRGWGAAHRGEPLTEGSYLQRGYSYGGGRGEMEAFEHLRRDSLEGRYA